jgi:hypothetical protein
MGLLATACMAAVVAGEKSTDSILATAKDRLAAGVLVTGRMSAVEAAQWAKDSRVLEAEVDNQ